AVVIQEKFSASRFWSDIVRWDCTAFQYIGEFCRYLLHAPATPDEGEHRLQLACGNGLAPDVWTAFKERFKVPRILEFYASTEGASPYSTPKASRAQSVAYHLTSLIDS